MAVLPQDFTLFCDQEADRTLFLTISAISPFLAQIPNENIKILPKGTELVSDRLASIVYLATYDRPDFIFLFRNVPVLVCELTEHGYTGDNPLQRFTRFATTAENNIPFIYFTPFSRVRDDELDDLDSGQASKRNVNTNVWKGMSRLTDIFQVPQIAIDWPLASNGKALKLGTNPTLERVSTVFSELLQNVENILMLAEKVVNHQSILDNAFVAAETQKVNQLWSIGNTRDSVGRSYWTRESFTRILEDPKQILEQITREGYFFKDKPERLLALQCIENAEIAILDSHGTLDQPINERLSDLLSRSIFDTPLIYYSGYKWRSDPQCGVAVNLDYLFCRHPNGLTPRDRDHALILFYPRVFYSRQSTPYTKTVQDIDALFKREGSFYNLFVERYKSAKEADKKINQLLTSNGQRKATEDLIGVWGDGTKQSRIFRQYCDIVILADAIIVGNHWRADL